MEDRSIDMIKELQRKLSIDITGEFDSATRRSLRYFQKQKKLPITGELDPSTFTMLGLHLFEKEATKGIALADTIHLSRELHKRQGYPDRITICHSDRFAFELFTMWDHQSGLPKGTKYLVDRLGKIWDIHPDNMWGYHIEGVGNRIVQSKSVGITVCGGVLSQTVKQSLVSLLKQAKEDFHIEQNGALQLIEAGMDVDAFAPQSLSSIQGGIWLSENYTQDSSLTYNQKEFIKDALTSFIYAS